MEAQHSSSARLAVIFLASVLTITAAAALVSANDERVCFLIGCTNPGIQEDLVVTVHDESGNPQEGATVTVTQNGVQQNTTDENGKAGFENLRCDDPTTPDNEGEATIRVDHGSNFWGEDTTTVNCQYSSGDDRDNDDHDFDREAPLLVSAEIPDSAIDGQTLQFEATIENREDEPREVRVELTFERNGLAACTSMTKEEETTVGADGDRATLSFPCPERIPVGTFQAQFTVYTSYGAEERQTDQSAEHDVHYQAQDDCGQGDDAPDSAPGWTQPLPTSCSGELFELDEIDAYRSQQLKKTSYVRWSTSGSMPSLEWSPSSLFGEDPNSGQALATSDVTALDYVASKASGSSGAYDFSVSIDEPNDCGTNNDLGRQQDAAPIPDWQNPLVLCTGEVWYDIDDKECVEYEKGRDHTLIAAVNGIGIPDPTLQLYDDDWNRLDKSHHHETRNAKNVIEVPNRVDDADYFVCIDARGDLDSEDFPDPWRFSLAWHGDCNGNSQWGDSDASDTESDPTEGPPSGELCNGVMDGFAEDDDWWVIHPNSEFGACLQNPPPELSSIILLDSDDNFVDAGTRCATASSGGTYKVGILNSDSPVIYEWAWG